MLLLLQPYKFFRTKFWKYIRLYLIFAGILANIFIIWMAAKWPVIIDQWLVKTEEPKAADYIICLSGGLGSNRLPTEEGLRRTYTAVQLFADGLGARVIFQEEGPAGSHRLRFTEK